MPSESDLRQQAKHPVTALAGPYGHPVHPILVTVPIGAWTASLVFDIASHVTSDPAFLAQGSLWLIATGVIGWSRELDYALRKDMWSFHGNRIAVRFQYECHDADGQCYRSYGNELWEFDDDGLMRRREASINDVPIGENERHIFGPRPESERERSFPVR